MSTSIPSYSIYVFAIPFCYILSVCIVLEMPRFSLLLLQVHTFFFSLIHVPQNYSFLFVVFK